MGAPVGGDAGRQAYQETLLLGILEPSMKLTKVVKRKSNSVSIQPPRAGMPERFSMAIEAPSLNIDLSGRFRKLVFDRGDADLTAAALAATAAYGTGAELRVEDRICPQNVSMHTVLHATGHTHTHSASRMCRLTALQQVRRPLSQPSLADVKVGIEWLLPEQRLRESLGLQQNGKPNAVSACIKNSS